MKSICLRQLIAFITIALSAGCASPQAPAPAKAGVEGYHCSWGRKVSLNIGAGVSLHCLDMKQGYRWKFMPSVRIGIEFR